MNIETKRQTNEELGSKPHLNSHRVALEFDVSLSRA